MSYDDAKYPCNTNWGTGAVEIAIERPGETRVFMSVPYAKWNEWVAIVIQQRQMQQIQQPQSDVLSVDEQAALSIVKARSKHEEAL